MPAREGKTALVVELHLLTNGAFKVSTTILVFQEFSISLTQPFFFRKNLVDLSRVKTFRIKIGNYIPDGPIF